MENANLSRSLKRTFYSLSRRYGTIGSLHRKTATETNYVTGEVSEESESINVRNMVQIPVSAQRQIIYTASMMQTLRPFAWQGGQGHDGEETMFMILLTDIPEWGNIEASQWIRFKGSRFEVSEAIQMPGGWILSTKRARGTNDTLEINVDQDVAVTDEGDAIIEP